MEEHSKQKNVFPYGGTFKSVLCSSITQMGNDIPDDILFKEILPKVPTKSLLRFKRVSKSWLACISSDSTFIADHTAHHSTTTTTEFTIMSGYSKQPENKGSHALFILSHDDSQLVEIHTWYFRERHYYYFTLAGAGNGLACIKFNTYGEVLVIWNPVTREHRHLPEPTLPKVNHKYHRLEFGYCFGFGKDSYTDYKLVRLVEIKCWNVETTTSIDFQLFTKSSGRWRHLDSFTGLELVRNREGLAVDGTMYWPIEYQTPSHQVHVFDILSFDLCSERFQALEGPARPSDQDCKLLKLIKWKGCLAVLIKEDKTRYQLWVRTNYDQTSNFCWKNITVNPHLYPSDDWEVIRDRLFPDAFNQKFDHMPTFVSPN